MTESDEYAVLIGKQISEILSRHGQTQASLAAKLGISRAAVNKWVNGQIAPSPRNIARIASATGCTTDYLLPRIDDDDSQDGPKEIIKDALDRLSKQQLEAIAFIIKTMV